MSQANRLWTIGAVVIIVAIVALGWLVGVQPALTSASTSNSQASTLAAQQSVTQSSIVQLKKDYSDLPSLKEQLTKLRESVPSDAQESAFLLEVQTLAAENGVTVTGFKPDSGVNYTPPAAAVAPASGAAGASASPSASATPSPEATAPATPTSPTIATNPAITSQNFVAVPVTVTVSGPPANLMSFIQAIQHGQRLYLVNSLTVQIGDSPTAVIGGYVYVLLNGSSADPAASAGTVKSPSASPSAAPAPSESASSTPSTSATPTP